MRRALVLVAILAVLLHTPALADIDNSAYEAGNVVRDEREREQLRQRLDLEAEIDRRRTEEEALREEQARKDADAREAMRPLAERLTERHCTLCHTAENYVSKRHTWLVWRLVVARMVWLNDAPMSYDVQETIAEYLAATYPALPGERITEFAYALAALIPLLVAPWGVLLLLGRRRIQRR